MDIDCSEEGITDVFAFVFATFTAVWVSCISLDVVKLFASSHYYKISLLWKPFPSLQCFESAIDSFYY